MKLDISVLENAISRLQEGLERYEQNIADIQIRDGLIQRFEFTYELSHIFLKRYLESISPTPELYDAMPFEQLIRSGNETGILRGDWTAWRVYRQMHAKTSHTYDENIALQVVAAIPDFLNEAVYLRNQLKTRIT